jgi:hypothetical protein
VQSFLQSTRHRILRRMSCAGRHAQDERHEMTSALIIRPSSLGDIVHAMPIVHDLRRHHPGIVIDWVSEEPFAGLIGLNRGVRRVIPVALRRWRHHLLSRATWREFAVFRRQLGSNRYTAVIDLQEQVKGALLAWLAHGPVHGPDRASIREPLPPLLTADGTLHELTAGPADSSPALHSATSRKDRRISTWCRRRSTMRRPRATLSFCTRPAARTSCGRMRTGSS